MRSFLLRLLGVISVALLICLIILLPNRKGETVVVQSEVAKNERPIRSLSLAKLKASDKDGACKTVGFILNSISRKKDIVLPVRNGDKLTFNLKDYGIDPKTYDDCMLPNMDVGSFIRVASLNKRYTNFLDIKNLFDFLKLGGADKPVLNITHKWQMTNSLVVRASESIIRSEVPTGALWSMTAGDQDINAIFLPNGLLAYCITDRRGNMQDYCDPNVMHDPHAIGASRIVYNAASCFACHANDGIMKFDTIPLLTVNGAENFADRKVIGKDSRMYRRAVEVISEGEDLNSLIRKFLEELPMERSGHFQ